jgi:hypothetical protein
MDGKEALEYAKKIAATADDLSQHHQPTVCPDAVPFEEKAGLDGVERALDADLVHDGNEAVSPDAMPFDDDARPGVGGEVSLDENELVSADAVPFDSAVPVRPR